MNIKELLDIVVKRRASDLHLLAGFPPTIRVDGELVALPEYDKLSADVVSELIFSILSPEQGELIKANKELDFSYQYDSEARFRINVYVQRRTLAVNFRHLPVKIPTIDELNLPGVCHSFAGLRQGFILVVGPTGQGKSTTIAAVINEINLTRAVHIVTIEDPIEYIYPPAKSVVSQREMHLDTYSWNNALRGVLREDPDVVLIGEMRDFETISAALTIAETGHLVFATLHTNDAAQTVDRVVDVFPENQQKQARLQLGNVLEAIISQRLVPRTKGGRLPATEILLATPAVRASIREGKSHMINNIMQTSGELGMMLLEKSLAEWVKKGEIALETAQNYCLRPEELMKLARR
ncbi:MAG: type IV pilus twitching motility protein PilT [Patescibacteria group bacterium]